jgi:hypothetical protein
MHEQPAARWGLGFNTCRANRVLAKLSSFVCAVRIHEAEFVVEDSVANWNEMPLCLRWFRA